MDIEKLDLNNVLEVEFIKNKLNEDKKLLDFFMLLLDVANKKINKEEVYSANHTITIEENVEPELSDHESDDELPNPEYDY